MMANVLTKYRAAKSKAAKIRAIKSKAIKRRIIKSREARMRNKRFIAGAVCPKCKLADKIFTYLKDVDANNKDDQWRACASCDFEESLAASIASQQEEIPTRVNQNRLGEQPLAHEVAVEAVKFIDPK